VKDREGKYVRVQETCTCLVNSRQVFLCRIGGYVVVPAEGVVELGGRGTLQALEHSHVSLGGNVATKDERMCTSHPEVALRSLQRASLSYPSM